MLFGSVETMNNAAHVLEVIDATLDKLDHIEHAEIIDRDGKDIVLKNADIEFQNVTFSYDKTPVLRNISFSIPQGSTTAIVGPSGSGKTTICNLIARFYDVDSGKVLVGGENVRDMTCDSLLRNISMVFQKVYLFHDTIENNIRFGNPNASQEEVIAAAKKLAAMILLCRFLKGIKPSSEKAALHFLAVKNKEYLSPVLFLKCEHCHP